MSAVTYEEMEAKRQEMITAFKDIASAMTRCVAIIEDYTRVAPSTLTTTAALSAIEHSAAAAETLAAAAAGGKSKRARKEKKPKDPNAPKRPPSAYLLFQNDVRDEIRRANPEMPYKEILSVIAARWKELDDPARKVYDDAYNDATSQYRAADEAYKIVSAALPYHLHGNVVAAPAPVVSDDESSSEEDSSSEVGVPTLATPTPAKKDKKRKSKDDEVVAPVPTSDKKIRKKK